MTALEMSYGSDCLSDDEEQQESKKLCWELSSSREK